MEGQEDDIWMMQGKEDDAWTPCRSGLSVNRIIGGHTGMFSNTITLCSTTYVQLITIT